MFIFCQQGKNKVKKYNYLYYYYYYYYSIIISMAKNLMRCNLGSCIKRI